MDAAMTEAGYQEVRQTEDQGRREANMDLEADALKVIHPTLHTVILN